jgi:hypothetical protein
MIVNTYGSTVTVMVVNISESFVYNYNPSWEHCN